MEELLAERGVEVHHASIYRWVQRFTPALTDAARPCRHAAGTRWQVDETYVKVGGRWVRALPAVEQQRWLLRAVDDPDRRLGADLLAEFRRTQGAAPAAKPRTAGYLLARADELRDGRRHQAVTPPATKSGAIPIEPGADLSHPISAPLKAAG